ncbi:common plant regulatory factor 1 isoform X1 [Cinnamomum micranthum f. kanehirae]|uniref:Common plant regulatory factor 1 isoform X1 n=1 Tax=Cinnamomum micranthum f. kanehirae TaxID=337451 RepID=A0A443Q0F1_9MAGN|nr:common plant regulatory factor 1 isoform X1 [Cinnamomum micranthum f. kanehirae]
MGKTEAGAPKSEKPYSPVQEQGQPTNVPAYPDWAAIQAYYGHGVGLPPYFSSAMASGHALHPYMWGPQPMMTPYGAPYAAIYPHGGLYAHPSVPIGSHTHGHGITSSGTSDNVASLSSMETPAKSSGNKGLGLMKKLKGFDGLAVSTGCGNAENAAGDEAHGVSQSVESGGQGSSDGSDGNTALGGNQMQRKRSCENLTIKGVDESIDIQNTHGVEPIRSSSKSMGVTMAPASVARQPVGTVPLHCMAPGMEFSGPAGLKAKSSAAAIPAVASGVVPAQDRVPSELQPKDERELKRERRKQSNRESARRSRLRKQAETEELATKVESMNVENMTLKNEINRLRENLEKLRREHSALKEKLKDAQLGEAGHTAIQKRESQVGPPVAIENLLSRVNNSGSVSRSAQRESEAHENSTGKLYQLLESKSRPDAVAAG